ncbi:MAG: hypothetical protein KA995_00785 [Paludibacteraceae bacterium]|jgi:hypothetical protein|nr:hypothetical protein [Paludibacteraceae bacterium]NLK92623.1 hypothetical protein [Bacteroidales bacterium]MBP6436692.1 hypothetical protein [Paludibacteraceae bacterium]MBP7218942.1 hypothetical protein [Paludibacteraceae bacterium]MBP8627150.1 hypothetical protein [Paludibacteraceae bacterium]
MDKIFKLILVAVSIVLGYLCVQSILIPIKFNEEKSFREKVVIARLADIRRAQVEYRTAKGVYTNSFDTLIAFVRQGKAPIILKEGSLTDKQLEAGLTEKEAVRQGIIKRDTTYVSILESLFGKNYPIDSIRYVPFSNPLTEFEMEKGELTSGAAAISVKVVEVRTPYTVYLNGLNRQEIINIVETQEKMNKYPGLKFGSVTEANNNAGNWE